MGEGPPAESNSNDQFVLPESDSRNDAISHLLTKDLLEFQLKVVFTFQLKVVFTLSWTLRPLDLPERTPCDPWIYLNGLHFDEQVCFLHSFYYTPESDSRNPESDSDNG